MRSGINNLAVTISDANGALLADGLEHISGVNFGKLYPGGLYGSFSCFVPRKITDAWQVRLSHKLQVYNGLALVWEGRITALTPGSSVEGEGVAIVALGYWADVLMKRKIRKPWCDTRIGQDVWTWSATSSGANLCDFDRFNRIRFTPKPTAWGIDAGAAVRYTAPTGLNVKRITFNYDLQEGAQAWQIELWTAATWSVAVTGTGSLDHTFATPLPSIVLIMRSKAAQTPPTDGSIYGEFSNIKVFTETGAINLTEVAKDVRALPSEISTDERLIASNTFALEPFTIDPPETLANILMKAADYGDSSFNPWAVGIRGSHLASDGKPILFAEQQPVLTDFDYAIRIDDPNVNGPLAFSQNVEDVRNYIIAEYQTIEGFPAFVTPDDDVTLKDTASIALYGERHESIQVQTTDVTKAKNVAKRILAARKDPQWRADGQISVTGYIRDKYGSQIPSSQIEAGKRLKIENWLNDLSGTGLTFLISTTDYDDTREVCTLGVGKVDDLATYLARLQAETE